MIYCKIYCPKMEKKKSEMGNDWDSRDSTIGKTRLGNLF